MNYEDLVKANKTIKTTPIHGKDYAEVNQRIKAFRMVFPEGYIKTELKSLDGGVCVFSAEVGNGDTVLGMGHAYEKEGSSNINRTSYIENCETSAVGRALGMAGFGIDTSVASAEEVQNAIEQQTQQTEKKASAKQIEVLKKTIKDIPAMLQYCGVEKIEDLTMKQASEIISKKGAK